MVEKKESPPAGRRRGAPPVPQVEKEACPALQDEEEAVPAPAGREGGGPRAAAEQAVVDHGAEVAREHAREREHGRQRAPQRPRK